MSEVDTSALQYVFPAELLKHFTIVQSGIKTDEPTGEDYLEVVFEEQNELPEGFSKEDYESKGFFSKRVQDSPLRGRAVFLELRKRRWRHKVSGEQITRDFTFLAKGTTFTAELADFLKQRN
ncbi:MAG: hypothetical protein P8N56_01875 [Schleiferiaceae bacterium]|nr:hypothetical protein [Schleiferiaceae bacterium]